LATGWKWLPAIFVKLNDCPALQVPENVCLDFKQDFRSNQSVRLNHAGGRTGIPKNL
jgi:hypothetical protein